MTDLYCRGLGLVIVGSFTNHDGFDGVMLGTPGESFHLEFTTSPLNTIQPAPTPEDVLVFYIPEKNQWFNLCQSMAAAGFKIVPSHNPYWDINGSTFEDPDGYRVVLQNAGWSNREIS